MILLSLSVHFSYSSSELWINENCHPIIQRCSEPHISYILSIQSDCQNMYQKFAHKFPQPLSREGLLKRSQNSLDLFEIPLLQNIQCHAFMVIKKVFSYAI